MRRVRSDSHAMLCQFVVNVQELSRSYETVRQIGRQLPSRIVDQGRQIAQEIQRRTKGQE